MIIGIGLTLRATLLGSAAVSDPYAVAGFSPPLVFDFAEEFYRTGGSTTTFDAAMTHTRSGNATMVDSDGVMKWAPHNLILDSTTYSFWSGVASTGEPDPDGTNFGGGVSNGLAQEGAVAISGVQYTSEVIVKGGTADLIAVGGNWVSGNQYTLVRLSTEVVGTVAAGYTVTCEPYSGEWKLIKLTMTSTVTGSRETFFCRADGAVGTDSGTATIYAARTYRSDLGGMVDNPDTGNSYVPTTSAARHLPRRGHHVYNGTSWVNEGVLVESETPERVQLLHTTNALVTQSHTVTAVPHTLHFTGTGTVTLSGASTAGPLVGTGTGENNRVSLTFTPTAASLTLTVSGTVTNAQLEVGSTPSSYIPNLAASGTVTRAADTITVPYANLPYSATAMSIQMDGRMTYADEDQVYQVLQLRWYKDSNNQVLLYNAAQSFFEGSQIFLQESGNVLDYVQTTGSYYSPGINVPYNIASRHGSTFINGAVDGTALTANLTPTALPDLSATNLQLGYDYMGCIRTFRMWANDLGDDGIEEATA